MTQGSSLSEFWLQDRNTISWVISPLLTKVILLLYNDDGNLYEEVTSKLSERITLINGSDVQTGSVKVECVCFLSFKGGYGATDGRGLGIGFIFFFVLLEIIQKVFFT